MVNNFQNRIHRGAISVSSPVANYVAYREHLQPGQPLPLERSSPIAHFLQSHLQCEVQYQSSRIIPELCDLYPHRIDYSVSGKLLDQGYIYLPDEAMLAFNQFMLSMIADDLSAFAGLLRPFKIKLKDVTEALHRQVFGDDEMQLEALIKRELRLREARGNVYVVHRSHANKAKLPNTHRPPRLDARTVPTMPELF